MEKKAASGIMLTLLLTGMLTFAFNIQPAEATGTIYIRADGSIDPPTAPMQRTGDVYILTGNVTTEGDGIVIERNNMTLDGAGYTVKGNATGVGIFLSGRSNITITNIRTDYYFRSISLMSSSFSTILENDVENSGYGIFLFGSTRNNTIVGNNIANNGQGLYFNTVLPCFNTISGNNITGNSSGIILSSSSSNTISENNITANSWRGIYVSYSDSNVISGNNIAYNVHQGICLETSSVSNTILENNITGNDDGVYAWSSTNNRLYHNNLINNINHQVYSEGSINAWDDSYPSGGNYWSNYTGADLFNGPNQNITGCDGIGDESYTINSDNRDRYPLMTPWIAPQLQTPIKGNANAVITSNVTVSNAVVTKNTLHFDASGPSGSTGWLRVIFPMTNTTEIKVFMDGTKISPPPFPVIYANGTHYFIYLEFVLSTHQMTLQFWLLGDITGADGEPDCRVNIRDLFLEALAYGSYIGHPMWNPVADLTGLTFLVPDDRVDIRDLALIAGHYGETYP